MTKIDDLKVKMFADGADLESIKELSKKSELEEKFNSDIDELNQETESLVEEIEKWQT